MRTFTTQQFSMAIACYAYEATMLTLGTVIVGSMWLVCTAADEWDRRISRNLTK